MLRGIIVKSKNNSRAIISTRPFIHSMIGAYLRQVYECNDNDLAKLSYSSADQTWRCENFSGTYEEIEVLTT